MTDAGTFRVAGAPSKLIRPCVDRVANDACGARNLPKAMTAGADESMVIDALLPHDAARCAELEEQLFEDDGPWPAERFLEVLAGKNNQYYLAARAGGLVVGYGGISRLDYPQHDPLEYHVLTIGVDPAWRGQGIGRRLLVELLG
jgi:ribosomal protein S18 acetylase RimI-like enzyme